MQQIKKTIENRQVILYQSEGKDAPAVYSPIYEESGEMLIAECEKLKCRSFHLVTISELQWNDDLSPWKSEPVFKNGEGFGGNAADFTSLLTEQIIPFAENLTGISSRRIIAGYSMAGLYALYAPYVTDAFSDVVCASGSVWYPNFVSYIETNKYIRQPDSVYLSLGDKESRTKNPYLSQTEGCMEKLYRNFRQMNIPSVFEMNQGNHYKDAVLRLAKGIAWTLNNTF